MFSVDFLPQMLQNIIVVMLARHLAQRNKFLMNIPLQLNNNTTSMLLKDDFPSLDMERMRFFIERTAVYFVGHKVNDSFIPVFLMHFSQF
jgi:hypothetical protein